MNVDEVLAKMDMLDTNEEEIQYIIDENLRVISIPPLGVVLGVEGDKDVNSAKFKMVRYYKGIDLSKFEIRINFANANGDLSYYTVKNPTVTDDTLTFEWLVGYLVTKYKGTVRFVVRMITTDASTGEVQQAFDTTVGEARSLEGLLVDTPTDEKVYDIVAQLKADLTDHVNNLIETIPEDYSELTKKVEDNTLGISELKEDLGKSKEAIAELFDKKITKFYANSLGETTMNDSDNGKIQDMLLYGKSFQNGTPTPDNPIDIQSVVNPKIEVCGKNLIKLQDYTGTINGITCTIKNGVITLKGTSTDTVFFIFRNVCCVKGGETYIYTTKTNIDTPLVSNTLSWNEEPTFFNSVNIPKKINKSGTLTLQVYISKSGVDVDTSFTPQLEIGSIATDFEPYKGQTTTLPYTLNAIPVSSGGNVTIDGQEYIADYVDIENKKIVKMVDESKFDETVSIIDNTDLLLATPTINDLKDEEIEAFKDLMTYYSTTNVIVTSDQLDGFTTFNYPLSMANGWNLIKEQLGDTREYIYDMELQSAEAYVNSEYAVILTELGV